jgi:hypothetical protein
MGIDNEKGLFPSYEPGDWLTDADEDDGDVNALLYGVGLDGALLRLAAPTWTDERIAEWTSTHDEQIVVAPDVLQSMIPTHLVTAFLRRMRDEYEAALRG